MNTMQLLQQLGILQWWLSLTSVSAAILLAGITVYITYLSIIRDWAHDAHYTVEGERDEY